MKNKYEEIIKERLDNRREWAIFYRWLLTHRELHQKAKRAYYKERPLQNLIVKLYFLRLYFMGMLFRICRLLSADKFFMTNIR